MSANRPAKPDIEIEITPEMIEAGADEILGCDLEFYHAAEIAERVFKTMLSCRNRGFVGSKSAAYTHHR